MKLDKLARKLQRELAANPKRAGLLGLMVLVACYFWAPLVGKWMGASGPRNKGGKDLVILGDDLPIQERAKTKNQPRWDRIHAWMQSDPRMASARIASDLQPFGKATISTPEPSEASRRELAALERVPDELDPREAGVKLSAVLVGAKRSQATINGRAYWEDSKLRIAAKEGDEAVEFELTEVRARSIVLSRLGKAYELKLHETRLAGDDRIERP